MSRPTHYIAVVTTFTALAVLLTWSGVLTAQDVSGLESSGFFVSPSNGNNGVDGSVLRFSTARQFESTLYAAGEIGQIQGLTYGPDGNIYGSFFNSSTNTNGQVLRLTPGGQFLGVFVSVADLSGTPLGLAFGPDESLYVAVASGQVKRFNGATGAPLGVFATGIPNPQDLVFGPDGQLYVATGSGNSVMRFNGTTGAFIDTFVTSGSGGLNGAIGLAFGTDEDLFVASAFTDGVLRFDGSSGAFLSEFASLDGLGSTPTDVAFGPEGDLYVKGDGSPPITGFYRFAGENGAYLGTFTGGGLGPFNTGMFFVDEQCATLTVPGEASGCFIPVLEQGDDEDGDGVDDEHDLCPDTLLGLEVDDNGCSIVQAFELLRELVAGSSLRRSDRLVLDAQLRTAAQLLTDSSVRNDFAGCVLLWSFDSRIARLKANGALPNSEAEAIQDVRQSTDEVLDCSRP